MMPFSMPKLDKRRKSARSHSIVIVEDAETHEEVSPSPNYKGRYSSAYDEVHGWPATPEEDLIDWTHFCMNIYSDEVSAEYVL